MCRFSGIALKRDHFLSNKVSGFIPKSNELRGEIKVHDPL